MTTFREQHLTYKTFPNLNIFCVPNRTQNMMTSTGGQCAKPRTVLTKDQAIEIFRLCTSGYPGAPGPTATSVAKAFGVNEKTVRDIWNGRTWCEETLPLDSSRQPKPRKKLDVPWVARTVHLGDRNKHLSDLKRFPDAQPCLRTAESFPTTLHRRC